MNFFFQTALEAGKLWYQKDAAGRAAVVSYYMLFAVTPLLLLTVIITSLLYGKGLVLTTFDDWGQVLGPDMLSLLHGSVANLQLLTDGFGIPIFGTLFFSTMVVVMFNAFTTGLHVLWSVQHRGFKQWLTKCLHSVGFIFVFELYLLFLIGLSVFTNYVSGMLGGVSLFLFESLFFILATTILFSLAYSILPWENPRLRERLIGGFVASVLFLVAKSLVSIYVATTPIPGLFGTAGLILVLLIWVYASCSIIYYGAAFAHILKMRLTTSQV